MKYIKQFDSFSPTGIDDIGSEVLPKYNPKRKKEAVDFIEDLSPSNRPLVFKWLGMEEPSLNDPDFDSKFDVAKEKLVNYFESNPNIQISSIDIERFTLPGKNSNRIPKVTNIGGTSHTNSFRIGQ